MVGIIVAMNEELEALKSYMENVLVDKIYEIEVIKCKIGCNDCIVTKCGIGKVNAARITQLLIDKYNVSVVINVGVAGGVNENIKIGDIVIGVKLVQHDFDLTAFGRTKGQISDELGTYFYSDKKLVEHSEKAIMDLEKNMNVRKGVIASR